MNTISKPFEVGDKVKVNPEYAHNLPSAKRDARNNEGLQKLESEKIGEITAVYESALFVSGWYVDVQYGGFKVIGFDSAWFVKE